MALGHRGANVDELAHGKVWWVHPHSVIPARVEI